MIAAEPARVASAERDKERQRAKELLERKLARKRRRRGLRRTCYESIESLIDGEQITPGTVLKGRIVA